MGWMTNSRTSLTGSVNVSARLSEVRDVMLGWCDTGRLRFTVRAAYAPVVCNICTSTSHDL